MKRPGRASPVAVVAVLCIAGVLGVLIFGRSGNTPAGAVNSFFRALGDGDVDGVIKSSYLGDEPEDRAREKWKETIHNAEYWRFAWQIKETFTTDPEQAAVVIDMYKNFGVKQQEAEHYQVPVTKIDGTWKVDAKGLNREMYPSLPR